MLSRPWPNDKSSRFFASPLKICEIIVHGDNVLWLFVLGLTLLFTTEASACVGRFLYVGPLNSVEDTVLSEILVLLINV